jgi:acetyl esterase/lipase
MLRVTSILLALSSVTGCVSKAPPSKKESASSVRLMAPGELQALPSQPADWRIAYGSDSSQFGDLRVPSGPGPHPVAVLVHGGCFKAAYATLRDLAAMADSLKAAGIATWNIEYRRIGQPGGGWPGTYLDVGSAIDNLRVLANQHALDLGRVVLVGHSAGGHLAMWASARARVPAGSAIHTADPLPVRGVLDLAGPLDLTANIAGYEGLCRDSVITGLLGGTPAAVPERYAHASPIRLLPLGVPQVILIGEYEDFVPRSLTEAYARAATRAGDRVQLRIIPGVGHFEIASPRASPWPQVESTIRSLLEGNLPPGGTTSTDLPPH